MRLHCVPGRENHLSVLMSINLLAADVIRRHPGATNMAQPPTKEQILSVYEGSILLSCHFMNLQRDHSSALFRLHPGAANMAQAPTIGIRKADVRMMVGFGANT